MPNLICVPLRGKYTRKFIFPIFITVLSVGFILFVRSISIQFKKV